MEDKNDVEKMDDVMLPGFRFHPTDEELVGFYLKRKIQKRSLPIELIKQVDIYKYDPWDLPNLATAGEKEWYFYCPRDRKYRNSARPNRVTGAGFWKATGTDRPIYSSNGTNCIGLKKSLVFYRGRAAKGIKTDWMMHEFRLPSVGEPSPPKKFLDKSLPPNDAWAICRIFKKTNSVAQRALSQSWFPPLPDNSVSNMFSQGPNCTQFFSENVSCTTEFGSGFQKCSNNDIQQASTSNFSALDIPSYKPGHPTLYKPFVYHASNEEDLHNYFSLSTVDASGHIKRTDDVATMLLQGSIICDASKTSDNAGFEGQEHQLNEFSHNLPFQQMQGNLSTREDEASLRKTPTSPPDRHQWMTMRSIGFPFSLPSNHPDSWKSNLPWDSPCCPSEMSTTYSTNTCYT